MTDKIEEIRAALEGATPGPWKIGIDTEVYVEGECDTWVALGPQNYDAVALVVNECIKNDAEVGINARLIALAPDMARIVLEQAEEIERLRKALRRHHEWHLGQDRDGAAWGIDPVDAYSESGLCEETVSALAAYRATEERG